MGNSNNVNGAADDFDINEWVVVSSPGGRYLGRPSDLIEQAVDWPNKLVEAVSNGDCLKLGPALDFLAPMRPVQTPEGRMAMTRDPIITPPDFTLHDLPIYVKASAVYFCADMKDQDKNTYKDLVRGGLRAALSARAQSSGLTLAGPDGKVIGPRG